MLDRNPDFFLKAKGSQRKALHKRTVQTELGFTKAHLAACSA